MVRKGESKSSNVKKPVSAEPQKLTFSFTKFHPESICIEKEFNNYFCNEGTCHETLLAFICGLLPLLSNETEDIYGNYSLKKELRIHPVQGKQKLLERILEKYGFPESEIDETFEDNNLYQAEVIYAEKACRVIFQRIDNIISFLFFDSNHHIYIDKALTRKSGSMFYKYCPRNIAGLCQNVKYSNICFISEYLDVERIKASFGYDFSIE